MKINEIRDMNDGEIEAKIRELGAVLFRERGRKHRSGGTYTAGGEPNRHAMIKRDIARLKTIRREREMGK